MDLRQLLSDRLSPKYSEEVEDRAIKAYEEWRQRQHPTWHWKVSYPRNTDAYLSREKCPYCMGNERVSSEHVKTLRHVGFLYRVQGWPCMLINKVWHSHSTRLTMTDEQITDCIRKAMRSMWSYWHMIENRDEQAMDLEAEIMTGIIREHVPIAPLLATYFKYDEYISDSFGQKELDDERIKEILTGNANSPAVL